MMDNRFYVNVEGAIHRDDKWLMIVRSEQESHAADLLSMPGGIVEASDASQDCLEVALRREVTEEVGIIVSDELSYLESKHFITDSGERVLDVVFMGEYASGEASALAAEEVESVHWMTIEEIREYPNVPPWILHSMELAEAVRIKG